MIRLKTIKIILRNKYYRLRLKNKDFTIISNNCWGGFIYQIFNLKYNTPTIGLFFFADDYVEFCRNIKYYLSKEIIFIQRDFSKYKKYIIKDYPIGKIDNIEIHFMHYKSCEEAKEKWDRRKKRINWNNIIFKFSQRDLCKQDNINDFINLNYENKICFVNEKSIYNTIYIRDLDKYIDETNATLKKFNVLAYLNSRKK